VATEMVARTHIADNLNDQSVIFARWCPYVPQSNTWFLGPMRLCPQMASWICSAVFAELTVCQLPNTYTETDRQITLCQNIWSNSKSV